MICRTLRSLRKYKYTPEPLQFNIIWYLVKSLRTRGTILDSKHAQRRYLARLQRRHRGSRWRLQAYRLHSNTLGTPAESTQCRSTPATKSADQGGHGSQHGVCHCGSWGTICPQPPCTADTASPVIRQKPAEDEVLPGASDLEVRRNIDEIAGQRASVAEEERKFTEETHGAAHAVLPEARRIPSRLGWCERPPVRAALLAELDNKAGGTPTVSARPNTPQQRGKHFERRVRECERRYTRV